MSRLRKISLILSLSLFLLALLLYAQKQITWEFANQYPTAQHNMVTAEGFNIHYKVIGQGEPVLLLHGISASIRIWQDMIPYLLKNGYQVIAVDIPGFGLSEMRLDQEYGLDEQSARINAFLDKINIKKVHLVGSSMGGALALWLAAQYPERYHTVSALAAPSGADLSLLEWMPNSDFIARIAFWFINKRTLFFSMRNIFRDRSIVSDERLAHSLQNLAANEIGVRIVFKAIKLVVDPRTPEELAKIKQPTLLIHTDADKVVPLKSSVKLQTIIPHAELITHPTAGHHMMEDMPEWTALHLVSFFKKHPF